MPVPVRTAALRRWLRSQGIDVVGVRLGERRALTGGVASPLVERVEIHAELADGRSLVDAVLAKRASPGELVAMREIAHVEGTTTFPAQIDAGRDDSGAWLVMPFYAGSAMTWDAEPPGEVYSDLARLHAKWRGRAEALPSDVPRVDAEFCRRTLLDYSSEAFRRAQAANGPSLVYHRGLESLRRWGNDELLYTGLASLPATFLHGDVYGLNILVADGEPPRLVDWGSARIGPAMLDVTAGRRADGARAYHEAWLEVTGKALGSLAFRARPHLVDGVQLWHVRRRGRRAVRSRPGRGDARRRRGRVREAGRATAVSRALRLRAARP